MFGNPISKAISALAAALEKYVQVRKDELAWHRSHAITKLDLIELESRLNMKLSEIKTVVATAAKQNAEAFGELGTRIGDLQKQIDDLIAGNSDPDVTDAEFLTALETLKTNAQQLADIVPNPA